MKRTEQGDFLVSADEMFTLRQGLFITNFHLDPAFGQELQTLTGVEPDEFWRMMREVDSLRDA